MSEAETIADIRRLVTETLGDEYTVETAVHADGEAYSVNVMHGPKVAIRAQAESSRRAAAMLAESLNRLWALNMLRQHGHCSQ